MQSEDELKGKLQAFPDVYQDKIGEPLNFKDIEYYLETLINKKKFQFIEQAFSSFTIPEARTFIEMLKKQVNPANPKKTKVKKND